MLLVEIARPPDDIGGMAGEIDHMLAGAAAGLDHIAGFPGKEGLQYRPDRLVVAVIRRRIKAAVRLDRPAVLAEFHHILSHISFQPLVGIGALPSHTHICKSRFGRSSPVRTVTAFTLNAGTAHFIKATAFRPPLRASGAVSSTNKSGMDSRAPSCSRTVNPEAIMDTEDTEPKTAAELKEIRLNRKLAQDAEGIKAMADIAAADIAIRKRTENLRAIRLAKEAAERGIPTEAKAKAKKKKTT
jgi:hypothetical protein